jgi:basic membrane protein A and related proteins
MAEWLPRATRPAAGWRGLILVLIGSMFLMPGCMGTPTPTPPGRTLKIGLMITPQGLNDQGFNDLAFAGLKAAEQKFGIEGIVIEPSTMKEPEDSLRFFTAQSFDAIVVVGVAFQAAIRQIAQEKPNLPFFLIDTDLAEGNIRGISFREDEGSYLCGYLAASMARGARIGFIGGVKIPVIERFARGYRNGAKAAKPEIEVEEIYVAEDFSGFNRPDQANALAMQMFNNGCEVIYAAAGASGLGVISAGVKQKKFVIGVDMNQDSLAPGLVLTSMLKRVDKVVEDVIRTLHEGKASETVKRSYGMKDGAIDVTDFQFSQHTIGPDLIRTIGDLRKRIIAGTLRTDADAPEGSAAP